MSDSPWQDKEKLQELYYNRGLSLYEIAEKLGCSQPTVKNWMDRYDLERRSVSEALSGKRSNKANYKHPLRDNEQYPCWQASDGKYDVEKVYVHRLLAVAEYGFGELEGKEVHHKNGVKWDNRPSNIAPIDQSSHRRIHLQQDQNSGKFTSR